MPIARKQDFQLQDFTTEINLIPRQWGLIGSMNMFEPVFNQTDNISIDVIQERTDTFGDTRRGSDRNLLRSEQAEEVPLKIPFFTLDKMITPRDLQNLRQYGTAQDAMSVNDARMRIMDRIVRYHTALKEKIMANAIQGLGFAPNSTTTQYNYYTVFSRTQQTIDFAFTTATTDVANLVQDIYAQIIDNSQNEDGEFEITVLCSPEWFTSFVSHSSVKGQYQDYVSNTGSRMNPNRDRPGMTSIYREFEFQNVRFIEHRGQFGSTRLIPQNQAYAFPNGIPNMFELHFAPADHMDYVNTVAQDMYLFEMPTDRKVDIQSESSMLGSEEAVTLH